MQRAPHVRAQGELAPELRWEDTVCSHGVVAWRVVSSDSES